MPAKKFVQPDYTTQSGTTYPLGIDAGMSVLARLAASYNPCAEDTPSALKVVVQAGVMFVNGLLVANADQTVTLATADATNPRIDRVVIDALTGVASKVDGTPAASPTAPSIPAGKLPMAQVLVTAGMTIVGNSAITDERANFGDVYQAALNKPCASGFTRIAPNFCIRDGGDGASMSASTGACQERNLSTLGVPVEAKAAMLKITVIALSVNSIGLCGGAFYVHPASGCSGGYQLAMFEAREQVAVTAGTELGRATTTLITKVTNQRIYVDRAESRVGSSSSSLYVAGYFD